YTTAGKAAHPESILFHLPRRLDPQNLVAVATEVVDGVKRMKLPPDQALRQREGFALTDPGMGIAAVLSEANYCIWCHNQGRDSCSTGFRDKSGGFRKSAFGHDLTGCPLDEKISEMNFLKANHLPLSALAVATVDNPMLAATGHRICNDCMKACVYQKQQPVDIPQIETRVLKDVLTLPYGFEIYSLLTRWNPLNLRRPVPLPDSGYTVLVVGMGPAGYTLAHHLLNDGHRVIGIDGLKIEPLEPELNGVDAAGNRLEFDLIARVEELQERLDHRISGGFGGVAEYGITVRWDKNYLKLIRLLLQRRENFALYGGVRFGGTITAEQAFALGVDHIALCTGAGRPTVLPLPHGLARGVRQASDFLMALQLTGAGKAESLANLQLRLPVVVIGGGLTAIDTTTESLAYYPVQVEKFLSRLEALGGESLLDSWSPEDQEIAREFIDHARAIRRERAAAQAENRPANLVALLQSWGGASLVYRRKLTEAPSYSLNHEEVAHALEEGIFIIEEATPVAVAVDGFGATAGLKILVAGAEATLPARSLLVAAGTQPNTVWQREAPDSVSLDGKYFQASRRDGTKVTPIRSAKPEDAEVLLYSPKHGLRLSFFGDLHPSFAGNVVKAMASAKRGYPLVTEVLHRSPPSGLGFAELRTRLNQGLLARVERVERLTPTIVEVVIHAPFAAQNFQPGQFYRLQNYETTAAESPDAILAMEGLAVTGAAVDREAGTVSVIVLEMGGSSSLCDGLRTGEPVVLMGPTGAATALEGKTVLLAGGGLGNAVLFSIGQSFRSSGARVIYFAAYKQASDRYKVPEIERAADQIIWCCDLAPGFAPNPLRPQDRSFVGNIVAAMAAYGRGELGQHPTDIPLPEVEQIIAIGSDRMMAAVARARHGVLQPLLSAHHRAIGSINSPMQCMMKEICAQCLQRHIDPITGAETMVFSCFNQDQPLDSVDWQNLSDRLGQNSVAEKLSKQWLAFAQGNPPHGGRTQL
ncbi:MAG: FAD-dependent oxidoreductase, partial [Alphaproteobacteria bacterium]|nr:FAD-dependent oxidoreductase [Alphaproteobacteria bacterium]